MSDTSFQPGSSKGTGPAFGPDTFHPSTGLLTEPDQSLDPGDPTTIFSTVQKARANNINTANVAGFAITPAEGSNTPVLKYGGPLTLPTEVWESKLDESPAVLGVPYYLSSGSAGIMTATPPSGGGAFVTPLGFFSSEINGSLTFMIQIGTAVSAT